MLPENNSNHIVASKFVKFFDGKKDKIYRNFTNENSSNISFMLQQVKKLDRFQEINLTDLKKKVIDKVKCSLLTVKMTHFQ